VACESRTPSTIICTAENKQKKKRQKIGPSRQVWTKQSPSVTGGKIADLEKKFFLFSGTSVLLDEKETKKGKDRVTWRDLSIERLRKKQGRKGTKGKKKQRHILTNRIPRVHDK